MLRRGQTDLVRPDIMTVVLSHTIISYRSLPFKTFYSELKNQFSINVDDSLVGRTFWVSLLHLQLALHGS